MKLSVRLEDTFLIDVICEFDDFPLLISIETELA